MRKVSSGVGWLGHEELSFNLGKLPIFSAAELRGAGTFRGGGGEERCSESRTDRPWLLHDQRERPGQEEMERDP